jgi:hypothetical protein
VEDVDVVSSARMSFASPSVRRHHVVVAARGRHRVGARYDRYDDDYDSDNSGNNDDDDGFYCVIVRSRLRPRVLGCRCCCGRK